MLICNGIMYILGEEEDGENLSFKGSITIHQESCTRPLRCSRPAARQVSVSSESDISGASFQILNALHSNYCQVMWHKNSGDKEKYSVEANKKQL